MYYAVVLLFSKRSDVDSGLRVYPCNDIKGSDVKDRIYPLDGRVMFVGESFGSALRFVAAKEKDLTHS